MQLAAEGFDVLGERLVMGVRFVKGRMFLRELRKGTAWGKWAVP